jgi:hypothetical protein
MLFFPTTDEDFQYFRAQGYTGSINDMHYAALGDLGYTGTITDRTYGYLMATYGSYHEAIRDLRDGSSVVSLLGPELVTNGTFDTDTAWTKGAGWTISGGSASVSGASSASDLGQIISVTDGLLYAVTFDVTSISANGRLLILSPFISGPSIESTGSVTQTIVSSASRPDEIKIRALSLNGLAMTATINNVSVKLSL